MTMHRVRYPVVALLIALMLILGIAQFAAAQDNSQATIKGTVLSIDEAAGSFVVQGEDGKTYTIFPGDAFDFTQLQVGSIVEVEGTANADGSIAASSVQVEDEEDDAGKSSSFYCMQTDVQHPFGAKLAEQYEVDYETVQGWFCDGFGWGQVKHALATAKLTEGDPEELLQQRADGSGWGQIWQELGLIGKSHKDAVDDEESESQTTTDGSDQSFTPGRSSSSNGRSSTLGASGQSNSSNGKSSTLGASGGSTKVKTNGKSSTSKGLGKPATTGSANQGRGKR